MIFLMTAINNSVNKVSTEGEGRREERGKGGLVSRQYTVLLAV